MISRLSLTYAAILSLLVSNATSDSPKPVLSLNSSPRKLFDLICLLDEQSDNLTTFPRSINNTQTTPAQDEYDSLLRAGPTWVSEPFCLPRGEIAIENPPYCVWTSRDFHTGRGISIIATPEAANTLASSKWFLNAHLSTHQVTDKSSGYAVMPLPGRGLGLIANSTYKRGDLVMHEMPQLLSSLSLEKSDLSDADQARLYRTAVSRLPKESRNKILGLHGHPNPKSVHDKFNANAFNVFDFAAVFPNVARTNHDCRPNAAFYFDKYTYTQRIHAVRDIKPGEEITISYLSHYLPATERFRRVQDHWGFTCTCALCSSSSHQLSASDARLRRIRELEVLIYQTHTNPASHVPTDSTGDAVTLSHELLTLYHEEGLDNALARAYDAIVAAYATKGDMKTAREFARLGVEAARLWPGPGSVESVKMQKVLE